MTVALLAPGGRCLQLLQRSWGSDFASTCPQPCVAGVPTALCAQAATAQPRVTAQRGLPVPSPAVAPEPPLWIRALPHSLGQASTLGFSVQTGSARLDRVRGGRGVSLSPCLAKVGQSSLFYQQLFIATDPLVWDMSCS